MLLESRRFMETMVQILLFARETCSISPAQLREAILLHLSHGTEETTNCLIILSGESFSNNNSIVDRGSWMIQNYFFLEFIIEINTF